MKRIRDYVLVCIRRINPVSAAALAAFVALALIIYCGAVPLEGEKELYSGIIRFHVLANSDSEEDQRLKLLVRDRVTEYTSGLLAECADISDAKRLVSENRETIEKIAKDCLRENGKSYEVSLAEGFEVYPQREYGSYVFPAGTYYSVRLKLGKAEGRNWWCVLFPPLCTSGAVAEKFENPEELESVGFSDGEISLISEPVAGRREIRFWVLEAIWKYNS